MWSRAIPYCWRILGIGVDHAETYGNVGVKQAYLFPMQQLEELLGLLLRRDKFHFNGQRAGKLEETLFVQLVVPPEPGHRLERGAAPDTELVTLFEEPFPDELSMMAVVLVDVESDEGSLHDLIVSRLGEFAVSMDCMQWRFWCSNPVSAPDIHLASASEEGECACRRAFLFVGEQSAADSISFEYMALHIFG